jgi:hypothetical protein
MGKAVEKVEASILEKYRKRIDDLRNQMHFFYFENERPYSFDYHFKSEFDQIVTDLNKVLEEKKLPQSPFITNHIPVFLPSETKRIAFFSYRSKSVREVDIDKLETLLIKQAQKLSKSGEFPHNEIEQRVKDDLEAFKTFEKMNDYDGYRRDIYTNTVQFNAYDKDDKLLIEKSFVRGGLVFDLKPEDFSSIEITYPRRRKQRSDKKEDFLPLKLVQIRGIHLPPNPS